MRAVDIIIKKRHGESLDEKEIRFFIEGYVKGEIPDYQVSALLMAIFFQGMSAQETAALTQAMLDSGERMDLSGIPGPFIDKHSTGGVGDKISLPLAPIVAACGVRVPMMSGRALGHTGGTLDKLESIPGYITDLEPAEFRKGLLEEGFAMTGQTAHIVPADKKLYALRDVTGTIESIPLITASILSKKVAEGAEGIVFDVKCGSGAFMKGYDDAKALAKSLVATGKKMGKKVVAVLTNMSQPLGYKVGNFLEIEEALDCLEGKGPKDVMELTYWLGAWMLVLGGKAKDVSEGKSLCEEAIESKAALNLFYRNVVRQGGNLEEMQKKRGSWRSEYSMEIRADKDGYIASIDALKIGLAGVYLGVGRNRTEDSVSPTAGFIFDKKSGYHVSKGERIATLFGKDSQSLEAAFPLALNAISIENTAPSISSLILEEITVS
ncbi:MAG TPA: thymidine phosphorylase [Rectinema sp.]|jgi:pyrimidine-nucleoside phosphorylase|nr:thymidine phosphorylase [Spirochaetaceae bacterium]HNY99165.1 thymidine phosphorylase [Rectinema sp.]HOD58792.1 thymidine phosphorylase [Rectinema sp.]HOE75353.1 thymidine phosphorylase [Rectinema sp.]HOH05277.1 thymidine phosphorylase [Rectinema sp.]